jgi:hypothetical protein
MESASVDSPLCSGVEYSTPSPFLQQEMAKGKILSRDWSLEETGIEH